MMFASTVAIGFPCNPHWYSSSNQGQPEVMNDDQGDDDDGLWLCWCLMMGTTVWFLLLHIPLPPSIERLDFSKPLWHKVCVQPSTKSLRNFRWSCFKWFVESPSYALIRWFQGQLNLWWKMHQKSKMMMKYAPEEENDDEICTRRGKLWWNMHQKRKVMMKYAPEEENDNEWNMHQTR